MPRSEKKFEQTRQNPIVFGSFSRFRLDSAHGLNPPTDCSCTHKSLWMLGSCEVGVCGGALDFSGNMNRRLHSMLVAAL